MHGRKMIIFVTEFVILGKKFPFYEVSKKSFLMEGNFPSFYAKNGIFGYILHL